MLFFVCSAFAKCSSAGAKCFVSSCSAHIRFSAHLQESAVPGKCSTLFSDGTDVLKFLALRAKYVCAALKDPLCYAHERACGHWASVHL